MQKFFGFILLTGNPTCFYYTIKKKQINKLMPFKRITEFAADLLFPKFCLGCKKEGFWICPECFAKINFFERFSCPICEKRLPDGKICENCRRKTKLNRFFSATKYENPLIKEAVLKLKYEFVKNLAIPLSVPINNFLRQLSFDSDFLIVPIPLHKSRKRWRGFNQAEEMAKEISKEIKIPMISENLFRVKKTLSQVEMKDHQKRSENMQNAFDIKNPKIFQNKKILLIDDVYTSGATMEECAKMLKGVGAKEIWGIVVAK